MKWDWKTGLNVVRSNFSGPGTKVADRIRRGDRGVTTQDKAANAHDIRYSLSKGAEDVRRADNKMVSSLVGKSSIWSPIESINNLVGAAGIKAKTIGEDLGVFSKD